MKTVLKRPERRGVGALRLDRVRDRHAAGDAADDRHGIRRRFTTFTLMPASGPAADAAFAAMTKAAARAHASGVTVKIFMRSSPSVDNVLRPIRLSAHTWKYANSTPNRTHVDRGRRSGGTGASRRSLPGACRGGVAAVASTVTGRWPRRSRRARAGRSPRHCPRSRTIRATRTGGTAARPQAARPRPARQRRRRAAWPC